MIRGNKERKIKEYLFIDRMAKGITFTEPEKGEAIVGFPYNYFNEDSEPFIEHRKDGKIIQTVNCADVAVIVFEE